MFWYVFWIVVEFMYKLFRVYYGLIVYILKYLLILIELLLLMLMYIIIVLLSIVFDL